jgi:hypothetical protein
MAIGRRRPPPVSRTDHLRRSNQPQRSVDFDQRQPVVSGTNDALLDLLLRIADREFSHKSPGLIFRLAPTNCGLIGDGTECGEQRHRHHSHYDDRARVPTIHCAIQSLKEINFSGGRGLSPAQEWEA